MNEFNYLEEAKIDFLPTYKFKPGTNSYDYWDGKRIPSFTDRMLYISSDNIIKIE